MDFKEAEKLAKDWGEKPCDHPHIQKETWIDLEGIAVQNGDYVCTQCGQTFTEAEYKEFCNKRK
uniref:Uncharacterized protein n=1 Tax=Prevotella sp. GTC17253 TaxID=3236793 RepID=A0AB33ISN2_9BACT